MNYIFEQGTKNAAKFILLHGTGGDEYSLLELARYIDPDSTILSFRGNIQENGMNRFFKRHGLNQFDLNNLENETDSLLKQIKEISTEENIPLEDWILLGYSNGANIAAHLLLEREHELSKGIFFHPMSLGANNHSTDGKKQMVWLSYGKEDPIVSKESFDELVNAFESSGSHSSVYSFNQGHELTMAEIKSAKTWLNNLRHRIQKD
ncbi:dienelactone hydrolase family protein [Enterococcus sp. DIV0660C]|uniref:alpha/beta hydrolase n=1 Tax=Enterococcus sp. DIV0660C TaxID=2230880 RepID=UPI001A8DA8D1|nr:dienelactone hydrolase family protein [Enterococcus sp. DIV0660C]MBO0432137.1 dienelactone hydrolase family protein [Enterococcus sp. DIV0660C]